MKTRNMRFWRRFILCAVLVFLFAVVSVASARSLEGAISGMVLDPAGKPVRGVTVEVWQVKWTGFYSADWTPYRSATTGRNGSYKIAVPPGTYRVWFVPPDKTQYCMEAYPDAAIPYWGDDVVVKAGRATTRISVVLDGSPGSIAGRVYDAATGVSLADIPVGLAIQGNAIVNNEFGRIVTGEDGLYRFDGLKPFMWGVTVNFPDPRFTWNPDYKDLLLIDEEWTDYGAVKERDADLELVGHVSITGTLIDNDTGLPLANVWVVPFLWQGWDGTWQQEDGFGDYTDENGVFELVNVPAGQVMVQEFAEPYLFFNGGEFMGEILNVQRGQTIDLGEWSVPTQW